MLRRTVLLGGLAAPLAVHAQGQPRPPARLLATVAMVGDLAREIAGPRARVETLLGEGVDPHLYRPTRADIGRLLAADMVLAVGLGLEGQMTETFQRVARAGKPVVFVGDTFTEADLLFPPDAAGHADPHIWMDVSLWSRAAGALAAGFSTRDPQNSGEYRERLADLQRRMAALDDYVKRVIGSIPAASRVLVTAHDAFGYFGRRYGLQVEGIQGLSTESEAGLRRVEDLVAMLVERRIPAVFVESSVPDRAVLTLVEGAGRRGHRVALGGTLFSDAMGATGTYTGTYIGMIDHNATRIARALGGEAPERGLNGRLDA